MPKLNLQDITGSYASVAKLNANFTALEEAIENTLSRDGTTPNVMEADFDMNSNRILNLPDPALDQEPVTLGYLTDNFGDGAVGAAADAANAAAAALLSANVATASASAAASSASNSATSASNAAASAAVADAAADAFATVNGIVKGDGVGGFSAAVAGIDYATAAEGDLAATALQPAAIGVSVQGYDADTAKLDVAQSWTATQKPDSGTAAVSTTSTYTFDGADQIREVTFTNAITVTFGAPTGVTENAYYTFKLKAGDTSARTFAWNTAYKFPAATAPLTSGTTTNGAFDIITFVGGASNTLQYVGHAADVR